MLSGKAIRIILSFSVATLIIGDALEVLAQSMVSDHPVLLAEAGRRSRRRRARRPAPAEPPAAEAAEGNAEEGAGEAEAPAPEGEGEPAAAPAGEEGGETTDDGPPAEFTAAGGDGEVSDTSGTSLRRSDRLDFDERLVKGQGARSGAVYLFKRTPRKLPELVSLRTTYRQRIVEPVLGQRGVTKRLPTKAPSKAQPAAPVDTAEAPDAEKAPGEAEAEGPSKAELLKQRRRRARLRARRRRQRRARQQKAQ